MRIVFLGTNGLAPTDNAHTVCCMLPEVGIVLDAGTGCFRVPQYQQTDALAIYLSHAHGDHTIGLNYLISGYLRKVVDQAKRDNRATSFEALKKDATEVERLIERIPIYAVGSVLNDVKARLGDWWNWQPLEADHPLPNKGKLSYFPLNHTSECYGFRLDWEDRSLAFVMDTFADKDADYVQRIKGVDVLIHDCYLPDSWAEFAKMTGHSHVSAVAQVAAQADVGRLVLTHYNTIGLELELESARTIFPQIISAYDGLEISF